MIVKCKRRARQSLYWPGITNDVAEMCKSCNLCMMYQYQQPPEPLTQEHQKSPWHKVASDIYTLAGKDYLLVVDYFSNYPEVMPLGSKTARSVIDAMKSIFSRHGIPVEHTSDNMPFTSFEFKQFAAHYGFNLTPTSLNHPNSNGKAEKGVQIVKRMLTKCYEAREDPMLALLNYRSTPLSCGKSPAELLMNRQLRNRLPQVFPGTTGADKVTLEKFRKGKASQKQ